MAARRKPVATATWANAHAKTKKVVLEQVVPILLRGGTKTQIAQELGIGFPHAARLVEIADDLMKNEADAQHMAAWRNKVMAGYQLVLQELWEVWSEERSGRQTVTVYPDGRTVTKTSPPDPRWLGAICSVFKEVSVVSGLRAETPVVQLNEASDATRAALAPLQPDAYLQLLQQQGGQLQVTVAPPHFTDNAMRTAAVDVEALP